MNHTEAWQGACDPDLLAALGACLSPILAEETAKGVPAGASRAGGGQAPAIAVALSAGADSAMLAVHAARLAGELGFSLHAMHIHHGLQAMADDWRAHAHRLAALLGISSHSLQVHVPSDGKGIEAAAREARYAGLARLAAGVGASAALLAHHADDQAETVMLRLLRGAGPLGLGAMAPVSERHGMRLLRPWLAIPRSRILASAARFGEYTGWQPVDDPTNTDARYTRAAVRTQLAPALDRRWPAWRGILARHAGQSRDLSALLSEYLQQDWRMLEPSDDGRSFSLAAWRALPPARQDHLIRHWLAAQGLRAPSAARLAELIRQLRTVHALGHDRALRLPHDGHVIACIRGRVLLVDENRLE